MDLSADYMVYSDDFDHLYAGGNVILSCGDRTFRGATLHMEVESLRGVLYGGVEVDPPGQISHCDALFFQAFPFKYRCRVYRQRIFDRGNLSVDPRVEQISVERLHGSDLYWAFSSCRIDANRKIRAVDVFPFIFGIPSIPFKRFAITRGRLPEKSQVFFDRIGISSLDGFAVSFLLRQRESHLRGDYTLKLYERELLDSSSNIPRGVQINGESRIRWQEKERLRFSLLADSGDESFDLRLSHQGLIGPLQYEIFQSASGSSALETAFELGSVLELNQLLFLKPRLRWTHNLSNSYTIDFATPLFIWKKINWSMAASRRIFRDRLTSDTFDATTTLDFTSSLLDLTSTLNFSRNFLQNVQSSSFALNLQFSPLVLLPNHISLTIAPYVMMSNIADNETTRNRSTPGINLELLTSTIAFPLGIRISPRLRIRQTWDSQEINQTEFDSSLSLIKDIHQFQVAVDYSLVSRYRSDGFWVEGYNITYLNWMLGWKHPERGSFTLRFFYNDRIALENIGFGGNLKLPWDLTLSTTMLYYTQDRRFQTLEVFIERQFSHIFKIQGGYSLALKRFFVKFFTL